MLVEEMSNRLTPEELHQSKLIRQTGSIPIFCSDEIAPMLRRAIASESKAPAVPSEPAMPERQSDAALTRPSAVRKPRKRN